MAEQTIFQMAHRLIGCDWGRSIWTADDKHPCPKRAVQRVVLYDQGLPYVMVQACDEHLRLIEQVAEADRRADHG